MSGNKLIAFMILYFLTCFGYPVYAGSCVVYIALDWEGREVDVEVINNISLAFPKMINLAKRHNLAGISFGEYGKEEYGKGVYLRFLGDCLKKEEKSKEVMQKLAELTPRFPKFMVTYARVCGAGND